MNQRYRNESTGGYHGDEMRERSMRDRDDRYAREAASARDWDQRDLGTRGGVRRCNGPGQPPGDQRCASATNRPACR